MNCDQCDMAEETGREPDCEMCPRGGETVDVIGDELREASDDELADLIGLD